MHGTLNVDLFLKRMLSVSGTIGRPSLRLHRAAKTQWTHVGPHCIDVIKARLLASRIAYSPPASRDFLVLRPKRILLFMIDNNYEHFGSLFRGHSTLQIRKSMRAVMIRHCPHSLHKPFKNIEHQLTIPATAQDKEIHQFAKDFAIPIYYLNYRKTYISRMSHS